MFRSLLLLVLGLGLAATQAHAQTPAPATGFSGRSSNALQERLNGEQRSQRATLVEADAISGRPDIELQLRGNATVRRADLRLAVIAEPPAWNRVERHRTGSHPDGPHGIGGSGSHREASHDRDCREAGSQRPGRGL